MLAVLLAMLPRAQLAFVTTGAHCSLVLPSTTTPNTLFALMLSRHLVPSLCRWWLYSHPGTNPDFCICLCWTSGSSSQPTPAKVPLIRRPALPRVHHLPSSFCHLKNRLHPFLVSRPEDAKQYQSHDQPQKTFSQLPVRFQPNDHSALCSCQATQFFTHFAVHPSTLNLLSLAWMGNQEPRNHYGRVCWHVTTNCFYEMADNSPEQRAKHKAGRQMKIQWSFPEECPSALD